MIEEGLDVVVELRTVEVVRVRLGSGEDVRVVRGRPDVVQSAGEDVSVGKPRVDERHGPAVEAVEAIAGHDLNAVCVEHGCELGFITWLAKNELGAVLVVGDIRWRLFATGHAAVALDPVDETWNVPVDARVEVALVVAELAKEFVPCARLWVRQSCLTSRQEDRIWTRCEERWRHRQRMHCCRPDGPRDAGVVRCV